MRKLLALMLFLIAAMYSIAQQVRQPDGGGFYTFTTDPSDELTPTQRKSIIDKLQKNEAALRKSGVLPDGLRTTVTAFQWPLAQAPGFFDHGYYGVSNYVDHNTSFPNLLRDYNCGTRTYDQQSGYNHKGTDVFTWPFPWQKMQKNAVQVVAAAPGVIIGKEDGNADQSCAFCTSCNWNAVYIMHADGSVAWYGHLKTNSVTSKAVGQSVTGGEYLGVVGSSGNSTGPHLHLEVYTSNTYSQLVDPYAGQCNSLNGNTSWWANQQPYYVPTLNKVMTHGGAPAMPGCPAGEVVNEKINFVSGNTVFLGSYYRDQQPGQQSVHRVFRPDGVQYTTWTQNFSTYYSASWWYYTIGLPSQAMQGMWRYEIAYAGRPVQTAYFAVNTIGYSFIGNGDWNDPRNWANESVPPSILPAGHEIIINPIEGGECIVNQNQQIASGAKLTVVSGKRMRTLGNLVID